MYSTAITTRNLQVIRDLIVHVPDYKAISVFHCLHFLPTNTDVLNTVIDLDVPIGELAPNLCVTLTDDDAGWIKKLFLRGWKIPLARFIYCVPPKVVAVISSFGDVDYNVSLSGPEPNIIPIVRIGSDDVINAIRIPDCKLNTTDSSNMTPLMHAACMGRTNTCKHLLKLGADPTKRDAKNRSLLYWALCALKETVYEVTAAVLEGFPSATESDFSGPNGSTCLTLACSRKPVNQQLISLFLRTPTTSFLDAVDEFRYTAAMHCLRSGNIESYEEIIKLGGKPPSDSFLWETLKLQCNAYRRFVKLHLVEFLVLKYPEFLNRQDPKSGHTPLMLSCIKGNLLVAEKLVLLGADVPPIAKICMSKIARSISNTNQGTH
eukprot:TRINITY_DN1207_c0_g1_i1.p1 TRINITY_DN1207_c0_g1~~TRINITY_DN1207_c0_g1_i1.p1  ORF type:complete len:377 (+),score=45.69 TRINITY_DN1207_c0_g1_i1:427-1557(+)